MSTFNLDGAADLVERFNRIIPGVDTRVKKAIHDGGDRIVALAVARVPKRSGELAAAIRAEYAKDGMSGWVKAGYGILARSTASGAQSSKRRGMALARKEKLAAVFAAAKSSRGGMRALDMGIYAPVVEYGDKRHNKPREPFLIPAFVLARPHIQADLMGAPSEAIAAEGLAG